MWTVLRDRNTSCLGLAAASVVCFGSSIFPCLLIFSWVSLSLFLPCETCGFVWSQSWSVCFLEVRG